MHDVYTQTKIPIKIHYIYLIKIENNIVHCDGYFH